MPWDSGNYYTGALSTMQSRRSFRRRMRKFRRNGRK